LTEELQHGPPAKRPRWRYRWSIAIYGGQSPLALRPLNGRDLPALTAKQVTDVRAEAVADPFLVCLDDAWLLFFEVWDAAVDRGVIAFASSGDCLSWHYRGVVLREPFHLSYPQVFEADGAHYMIPETRQADSIRLYRADAFPDGWRYVTTLIHGRFADATILRRDGRWWLFAQRGLDELRLFSSSSLEQGWREHPASPLWAGNRRRTRPAGRMVVDDHGRLLRFAQDGLPDYGSAVRVFAVDRLDEDGYEEHELPESPILRGTRNGWNAVAMHHVDAVRLGEGNWIAAVDGAAPAIY
jgi:hypothetical protein